MEDNIEKLVFNNDFRDALIKNSKKFVKSYLFAPANASENLAENIESLLEN